MLALQDRKNVECCFLLVVVAFCFARQRRPRARKLYGGRSQEGKRIKIILVLKKKEEEQASHFLPFFFFLMGLWSSMIFHIWRGRQFGTRLSSCA